MPLSAPRLPCSRGTPQQRHRPELELVAVLLRQGTGAARVRRLAHDLVVPSRHDVEGRLEPVLHQRDGQVRDVDAGPPALQLLSRRHRRAAPAERVQHHVPLVRRCLDDALQQGPAASGWGSLGALCVPQMLGDSRYLSHRVLDWYTAAFIQVVAYDAGTVPVDLIALRGLGQSVPCIALPSNNARSSYSHNFVLWIAFRSPARSDHARKAVSSACFRLNITVRLINVFLRVRTERLTKHIVIGLGVEKQRVMSLVPRVYSPDRNCL